MKAATTELIDVLLLPGISIHAAREGGDLRRFAKVSERVISIHAAREGGDQSATDSSLPQIISIHAAREGGDAPTTASPGNLHHFNPRRP